MSNSFLLPKRNFPALQGRFSWTIPRQKQVYFRRRAKNCGTNLTNCHLIAMNFSLSSMVLAHMARSTANSFWAMSRNQFSIALLCSLMSFSSTYFGEDDELDVDLLSDL